MIRVKNCVGPAVPPGILIKIKIVTTALGWSPFERRGDDILCESARARVSLE